MLPVIVWAVIPWAPGWVISDMNVGILFIFAISSAARLRDHHGRLGVELEVSVPRGAALGGADDLLRGVDRLHHRRRADLDRVAEPERGSSRRRTGGWGLFNWYWLPHLPMVVLFFISALAETNRPPFDLPEAESELVAGYQVEYSSTPFLLFMIGELMSVFFMCALISVLFFGGWLSPIPGLPDGALWMFGKMLCCVLHVLDGEGDRAALPLRPADADRLEGVPAARRSAGWCWSGCSRSTAGSGAPTSAGLGG